MFLSLSHTHTRTITNTGISVYINEVCQVKNGLEISAEIYKPSVVHVRNNSLDTVRTGMSLLWCAEIMSIAPHICNMEFHTFSHTQIHTYVLLVVSDPPVWNRHMYINKSHVLPKTHTAQRQKCVIPQGLCTNRDNKTLEHTYKHTSSSQPSYCRILGTTCFLPLSSSFTHSFLPCIPPGVCLTPHSTAPPYLIHNNFVHWLPWGCKEREVWRKWLKSHYCTLSFGLFFEQRVGHGKPFRDKQQGLHSAHMNL